MEISAQNENNNNLETTDAAAANKFPSLSSEEEGYLLGTPPTVSLDSDIQPCAIDIINATDPAQNESSQPSSLSNISENNNSEQKSASISNSSDYKCITTESNSVDRPSNDNLLQQPASDILTVDSSTDDQMSSGTFSQDEISPRFAELPATLSMDKRRTQSSVDPPRRDSDAFKDVLRKTSVQERTLSLETRSTSIASDVSEQEIPPTTPRSDPTVSPGSETKFVYEADSNENVVEKNQTDIMTQSIYIGSEDTDNNSEVSSESHLSTVTTQQTVSSSEDSKVTTLVTEESTSVFESVIKLSENVTENILEETKTITKSTKMAVEESIVLQTEGSDEEKKVTEVASVTDQKCITVVSTESSSVMVTKTDTRTYSDVLKSDSKQTVTTVASSDKQSSVGKDAAAEVLKSETVLQLVGSSSEEGSKATGKKLSYSEVVKADSKDKEDPIADWGKPLGLPSPIRPSTPAKQQRKTNDEPSVDTNKVIT